MESQSHYRVVRLLLRLDEVHKVPIIKHTTVSDREEERGRLKQRGIEERRGEERRGEERKGEERREKSFLDECVDNVSQKQNGAHLSIVPSLAICF